MPQTIEDYRRHMYVCMTKAEQSPNEELREVWLTVANSYRLLMRREERIEAQDRAQRIE